MARTKSHSFVINITGPGGSATAAPPARKNHEAIQMIVAKEDYSFASSPASLTFPGFSPLNLDRQMEDGTFCFNTHPQPLTPVWIPDDDSPIMMSPYSRTKDGSWITWKGAISCAHSAWCLLVGRCSLEMDACADGGHVMTGLWKAPFVARGKSTADGPMGGRDT